MTYKCRICGSNDVEHMGDICELCAIGQDPYASSMQGGSQAPDYSNASGVGGATANPTVSGNKKSRMVLLGGGSDLNNRDPYGNDITPQGTSDPVQVYQPGQVSALSPQTVSYNQSVQSQSTKDQPITSGITKNITVDTQQKMFVEKWFRSLFTGIPFTFDNDITMFQVFPDYSGTALNASGNACDQVIVYGKLNAGAVAENNDIEVYGHRDVNNNVIAQTIKNKASGTTVTPYRTIGVWGVWAITVLLLAAAFGLVTVLGIKGIVCVVVILLCLTNLPLVLKAIAVLFGLIFWFIKK